MGSEQSQPIPRQSQRAPPVRRGHTIAAVSGPDIPQSADPSASGNNSPGASICSDSELPYISYTVNRPIGDSPKNSSKSSTSQKQSDYKKPNPSMLQRRQLSLQPRRPKKVHDIVVVKEAKSLPNIHNDEDIQRLQDIPTFLPIMRGTLGLTSARDTEILEGLDYRPWVRLVSRYQAHLAACVQPLNVDQQNLASKIKETDAEVNRLHALMVEKQRQNARNAERLSRVREISHQLTRCHFLLRQTLEDVTELNEMLPEECRLEPFMWNET